MAAEMGEIDVASERGKPHNIDRNACHSAEPLRLVVEIDTPRSTGVPAANFVRSFSKWRDEALVKPVFVANHGRITHALIGIDQFDRLSEEHNAQAADVNPFELAEWIDEAVIVCDRDLVVESMNRVASAACRMSSSHCVGRNLYDCLPQLRGTLFDVHLMRTVEANESTSADIPSPLREGGWLRLQSFPLHERNVLLFRDITEEVERHRLADVKAALIEAMAVHNAIGYVRAVLRSPRRSRRPVARRQFGGTREPRKARGIQVRAARGDERRGATQARFELHFEWWRNRRGRGGHRPVARCLWCRGCGHPVDPGRRRDALGPQGKIGPEGRAPARYFLTRQSRA